MSTAKNSMTDIVRSGLEKACKEFTLGIEPFGFRRTLKMFWTRRHALTVDFINLFPRGSSYGPPRTASIDIRMHFGIRVLNDDFVAAAVNGPTSDSAVVRSGRYHLRFNAQTGSTYDRCVADLGRFVVEQGEPWFQRWNSIESLLNMPDSPLRPREREFLREAVEGKASAERISASLKFWALKKSEATKNWLQR